jgi:hypothetical protein
MRILKMKPAFAIALAGAILVSAVTVSYAVGGSKKIHKAHRSHAYTAVAVVSEPQWQAPANCGMRYYGGPKGGLWPAPCPGR